jgi:chromosome segregation ATPase
MPSGTSVRGLCAEINEALCAEIERLKARLAGFEEGTEIHPDLSESEVPELVGRYQKLGKRFSAVARVSEHLNQLVDNAHRRNHDLETELAELRAENVALAQQLRRKDRSNQELAEETERVLVEHAQILERIEET